MIQSTDQSQALVATETETVYASVAIELAVEPNQPEGFALLRLVLIDSLSPGRIVELPLDGGAVLTGRNGRGKTSLLQLLLLFYGESPNRIVTAEAGRDSFTGYYLPRTTSYLAFEYQRHGGHKRMVVAYADRAGERVLYRFIRSHFEVAQFVRADGDLVKVADFRAHLQSNGYQCSERQIESQTDYRNIIQGILATSTDKQHQLYLRNLTQDYAFTTTRQPLRQIEKIVSGMFRRKTNFEDLQSMVIDCVADETASHTISGDRRKIEDWPKGYKAYSTVMTLQPKIQAAELADSQLQAAELALGDLCAKYRSLAAHLALLVEQESSTISSLEDVALAEEDVYKSDHHKNTSDKATAQRRAEFAETKASELQAQAQAYAQEGIEALDLRVKNAPLLSDDIPKLEARRAALLGAQSEIDARYERLKQKEKDALTVFRQTDNEQSMRVQRGYEHDIAELGKVNDAAELQAKAAAAAARTPLDEAVQAANTEHGSCQQGVKHPTVDADATELVESKRDALDAARLDAAEVEKQGLDLKENQRKAHQEFLECENEVVRAGRQVVKAQEDLDAKRQQLMPVEGSLLHFLRQERPAWSLDIAKVIRGDMLARTDLTPVFNEPGDGLYGLSLNLERLQAHPASDLRGAEQEVEKAQQWVKEAASAQEVCRLRLEQVSGVRDAAEKACQLHQQLSQKARNRVQSAQAEWDAAKTQLELKRREALNAATERLNNAKKRLDEARQALKLFDAATSTESGKLRLAHSQRLKERQQKRDEEIRHRGEAVKRREDEIALKLTQYDEERSSALAKKGIDPAKLKEIDKKIGAITVELSAIAGFTERVQQWRFWKEHRWPELGQHQAEAAQARQTERQFDQTIALLDKQWKARSQELLAKINACKTIRTNMHDQSVKVLERMESLRGFPEVCVPEYDPSWTFDTLSGLANQYGQEARDQSDRVRRMVADVAAGFRLHQGSPPEQYLQSTLGALSTAPSRQWLAPLKAWFDTAHHEYRRILLMQAVSIASEVNNFYHTLEEFHRRVLQFNRELQNHLDSSLTFESISKIGVEVVSTIRELQYWPAICEMAEAHRAWSGSGVTTLPPPEFAQTIERLLDHWEVKTGIRADFKSLIRIQGEVTENGNRRIFKRASDLEAVSSNGLSYLVLATIFVAFINRIRRDAKVNIIWALDELKDLDGGNIVGLLDLLARNNITLVCAFPDPDPDTMALFRHRFTVEPDRRLAEVRVAFEEINVLPGEGTAPGFEHV